LIAKELDINRVVFIKRTLASQKGIDSTSADIVCSFVHQALKQKGLLDIEHTANEIKKVKQNYIWIFFEDIESLRKTRSQALNDCSEHMQQAPERYIAVELLSLPFVDHTFDLTLLAHFLFT